LRPLDPLLDACARRPAAAAGALVGYTLMVSATHDHVQDLAYFLQRTFTPEIWKPTVAVLGALVLVAAGIAARGHMAKSAVRAEAAAAWWGTCALHVVAFFTLLATNMEAVHFLQYALPVWPAYALLRRLDAAFLVSASLGAFDEAWQYAVLHVDWGVPYDANDLVLNTLGAALGCASILVFASAERRTSPPRWNFAAAGAAAVVLGGGSLVLRAAGVLSLYPEDGDAPILLSRVARPVERWESPEWGRGHFVIHPGVPLVLCLVLAAAFAWLDRRVGWRPAPERTDRAR
jgi:hypothetical protein